MHFLSRPQLSDSHRVAMTAICTQRSGTGAQKPVNVHLNRLRQSDLTRYAVFALVLCLIFPGSTAVWANDNQQPVQTIREKNRNTTMLNGKRLFYDQEQRQASTTNTDVVPGSILSDSLTVEMATDNGADVVEPEKPIIITKPAMHSDKIHYHARIEGLHIIRIIVNGLPCEAINRSDLTIGLASSVLNCKSIIAKRLQLVLLSDGVSIKAMDGKRVKGIITPGDSL